MDAPPAASTPPPAGRDDDVTVSRFSRAGMGTEFEILIESRDPAYARQAARTAFEELDHLNDELSRFEPSSDISRLNALVPGQSLRVGPAAMDCLVLSARLHADTAGAFDVTIGALRDCWRPGPDGQLRDPSPDERAAALACTGMGLLHLEPHAHTVTVAKAGIGVDLGAVGKGYAVDQMARVLGEWGLTNAVVHGGHSTALALGPQSDGRPWPLRLRGAPPAEPVLGTVFLTAGALSGSGAVIHGRHILDPRSGEPVPADRAAWAVAPTGAWSDAISTAFMVLTPDQVAAYCGQHPEVRGILGAQPGAESHLRAVGSWREGELLATSP